MKNLLVIGLGVLMMGGRCQQETSNATTAEQILGAWKCVEVMEGNGSLEDSEQTDSEADDGWNDELIEDFGDAPPDSDSEEGNGGCSGDLVIVYTADSLWTIRPPNEFLSVTPYFWEEGQVRYQYSEEIVSVPWTLVVQADTLISGNVSNSSQERFLRTVISDADFALVKAKGNEHPAVGKWSRGFGSKERIYCFPVGDPMPFGFPDILEIEQKQINRATNHVTLTLDGEAEVFEISFDDFESETVLQLTHTSRQSFDGSSLRLCFSRE